MAPNPNHLIDGGGKSRVARHSLRLTNPLFPAPFTLATIAMSNLEGFGVPPPHLHTPHQHAQIQVDPLMPLPTLLLNRAHHKQVSVNIITNKN